MKRKLFVISILLQLLISACKQSDQLDYQYPQEPLVRSYGLHNLKTNTIQLFSYTLAQENQIWLSTESSFEPVLVSIQAEKNFDQLNIADEVELKSLLNGIPDQTMTLLSRESHRIVFENKDFILVIPR